MNWTEIVGRPRPIEVDASRLLVVVDQLGEPTEAVRESGDLVAEVIGEARLRLLDHLVRHPVTLAYLLIDAYGRRPRAETRAATARRVRQLLANQRQQRQPLRRRRPWHSTTDALEERRRRHPILTSDWQPLDDALAFLALRDLLRVRAATAESGVAVGYGVTRRGRAFLDQEVYGDDRHAGLVLELCEVLRELLPSLELDDGEDLGVLLEKVARRSLSFRRDAQIPTERDSLPELFRSTFRERL